MLLFDMWPVGSWSIILGAARIFIWIVKVKDISFSPVRFGSKAELRVSKKIFKWVQESPTGACKECVLPALWILYSLLHCFLLLAWVSLLSDLYMSRTLRFVRSFANLLVLSFPGFPDAFVWHVSRQLVKCPLESGDWDAYICLSL